VTRTARSLALVATALMLTGAATDRPQAGSEAPRAKPLRQEEIKVQGELDHPKPLPLTPPRTPDAKTKPPASFLSKVLEAAEKEPF
jgi:hypothetical protein